MKSFFTYSRLVFDHGALDGASEVVVGGAQKTGEALGAAVETVGVFWKRMQVLKTSKDALRALREGYNRTANPLEKYPSDEEKNKQLLDFVAAQLKYPVKDVRDALYKPVGKSTLSEDKRRDILQKIIVLQSILPEMELTFAGVATHELIKPEDKDIDAYAARILNSHNDAWYKQRKNLFAEMMEKDISPNDVAFYLVKHQNIIQEYINSPKPKDVAAKYPELFLTESAGEINGHNLLDIATAYENARINVDLLHKSPDIQNASRDIPTPMHYSLYIFDIPKARKSGVTMKYRSIGEGQVGASGISDEPASRNAPISIPGLPGLPDLPGGAPEEKALDGKEGERLDPIGDLDTFAKTHKWKGAQLDPDVHGSRFDHSDLAKYVPRIERVLNDIATNPKYTSFWPILGDMNITVTPDDVRDINPFAEGFSWDNGKLKIDYNESEESIRQDVLDGLRSYNAYKKLGGAEKPEIKKDREELARQTELYIKNWDLLFPDYKNDASKNTWKIDLENAKDPQKFAKLIENDNIYADKRFGAIRESIRNSYIQSLKRYIDGWDANIGVAKTDDGSYMENIRRYIDGWISAVSVGKKDGGDHTKEYWLNIQKTVAASPDTKNIDFVVPWTQYFKANLEGTPVRDPVIVEGGKDKPSENHDSADKQKNDVIAALARLSADSGVNVKLMPEYSDSPEAKDDEYEYDEMLKKLPALSERLKSLTPDEKTGANNIGVLLTPERNIVRLGMPHVLYSHGLVEQTDGTKKIQIDVKSDTLKDIRAALSDSPEKQKSDVIAALAKLSTESGVKVDLMSEYSDSTEAKDDEYEYKEILKKIPALSARLKNLTPDEKTEANAIGVLLTPERNLVRVGMPRAYLHGLVDHDGTKKIQIDVKNDTLSDIRAAIKENSGKEGKEKTPESKDAIKAKIIASIKNRAAWKSQTAEQREAENFAGTGLTLEKIAKTFGIEGDPAKEDYSYKLLGDQIYGPEAIEATSGDEKRAKEMLRDLSAKHKFNVELQQPRDSYTEGEYKEISTSKNKFDTAFAAVKPSSRKVLAKAGVVLGKISYKGDEEGIVHIDGKYRIAIDWNEDADEITEQLDKYANKYESKVEDKHGDEVDKMTDLEMKEACDKRLNKLKQPPYKIKEFKYADGFDDYKGLLKKGYFGHPPYLDSIEKAFANLSDDDKKALRDDGAYKLVIGTSTYIPWTGEGKTDDHTITIDYTETSDEIKSDISTGIKDQKPSIVDKALGFPGWLWGKLPPWMKF